ncbi:MAG: STAS domain-containing protein [Sedimenticola sp.]
MELERIATDNGGLIIELHGEFDAEGAARIRPILENIAEVDDAHQVFLDLNDVGFLDSSGIGAIVFLFKRLRTRERKLELIGVHGQPQELIELLRISSAIPVTLEQRTSTAGDSSCAA